MNIAKCRLWNGIIVLGLAVSPVRTLRAELVLVEDGRALAPIVVFENAPPKTRRAADELAEYIEKVSGARPEVVEGTPDPLPASAIWVGYQPALDALFPDLDFDFQHPEEILIAANDRHLVIAGRDVWHPERLRVDFRQFSRRSERVNGVQQEYGTVNAVYTFLQDYLDVRWFWPGDTGEDILQRDKLAFAPFAYRHHPRFRGRGNVFSASAFANSAGHSQDWLRLQRLRLDSLQMPGGHPFDDWWERFHETHPEFFAVQSRGSEPRMARGVKLCKSNPAVWKQWLKDVEAHLEINPNQTIFAANANDGGYSGYCNCEGCRAWDRPDHPDGMGDRPFGRPTRMVRMADRQVAFANTLARMLKERYPDRELYVLGMAYGLSRFPPVEAVPDDNVIFAVVDSYHNRSLNPGPRQRVEAPPRSFLEGWSKVAANLGWRPNLGGHLGWPEGMPRISPSRVGDDLRFAADCGTIALYFDNTWEHWANQGPQLYMLAQMAWNPYADDAAILEDYFLRAYGPAAVTMRTYWGMLETTARRMMQGQPTEVDHELDVEVWSDDAFAAWNADFYRRGYELLGRAAAETADAPENFAQRVDFTRAGLDYMRIYFENPRLIRRVRDSEGADAEALDAARANWRRLLESFESHPTAFNPLYVAPNRRSTQALNPDRE